jgi:endonuclease-3
MKTQSLSHAARVARATRILSVLKSLYPFPKSALNYHRAYEFLFAVILSAQTTDKQVNKVTKTVFKKYTLLSDYAKSDLQTFEKDISSIGLYHSKAKHNHYQRRT